jgi:acyl-CoA thioester hydrolase
MPPAERPSLTEYRFHTPLTTRWSDNDIYGHINNVTYYSYFDTIANHYLIHEGGLDIVTSPVIGLVVESRCTYRAPLAYPDTLRAGLRVDKLGNRSVTYGIGIFKEGEEQAAAHGYFVHVFVDRQSR